MRSEERAGIISIIMLFLWGTLITEPFHIFARYIASAVKYAFMGLEEGSVIKSLILYVVVVSAVILMQLISQSKLGTFMPCAISTVFIAMLVIKSIHKQHVDVTEAICLAIPAMVAIALYLLKLDKGLKWFTDVYTYSLAIALLNALFFVPLAKLNGTLDKILYITNYNNINITESFKDLAGIPEIVWGFFLTAFASLPVIYLAMTGRRK